MNDQQKQLTVKVLQLVASESKLPVHEDALQKFVNGEQLDKISGAEIIAIVQLICEIYSAMAPIMNFVCPLVSSLKHE